VRAAERAEMEAWQRTQRPSGGGGKGFGTLGDLLKNRKL
jgi:small subunit ribosomal protein S1